MEALIGPDTVNTVPLETLDAYRDHGNTDNRLKTNQKHASEILEKLNKIGLSLNEVSSQLEDEGTKKFSEPFHKLLVAISEQQKKLL